MELKEKIKLLTRAYGVSGDEFAVSKIAAELMAPYVDRVEIDDFGNVTGYRSCGVPGAKKLLLDAHIDQIGFMVTDVTEEGFLRFIAMGVDQRMLLGSELRVLTKHHGDILGVVAAMPPHMQKAGDQKKSVPISEMVVDIGMTGDRAREMVQVGDYMVFAAEPFDMLSGGLCSKALDDRACLVCILHALELMKDKPLQVDLIVTATTKEEMGGHGAQACAYRENPDFAIAIDVTHARTADAPNVLKELGDGADISIGSNSHPGFARKVVEICRAKQVPHRVDACPSASGTNAWTMQMMQSGICTLVISLPLKYMHSPVEVLRMKDVDSVGRCLAEFAMSFDGRL